MNAKLNRMLKDQSGITALETAIILIAFVVVAAIFAFTVLSTGTFLTERSKEAAYSGLQEVRGSLELKGSVVANGTAASGQVNSFILNLASVAGGSSVDLCDTLNSCGTAKIQITFHDKGFNDILPAGNNWSVSCAACTGTGNKILSPGALATVTVTPTHATNLTAYAVFSLEIKPPTGGVLLIERTLPARIDSVTDLH